MTRQTSRRTLAALSLAFAALVSLAAVATATEGEAKKKTLADLAFISGSWEGKTGPAVVEEHWTPASGGAMLAVNRTVAGGKMVAFEYLRIVERADGVFYVAQPGGGKPTEFKLTSLEGEKAVFENPAHDFPKAISYEKKKDGSLVATVSGDGKSEEFPFRPMGKK